MSTKAEAKPSAAADEGDQVTTVKMFRSEAKALAIIAEAHGLSQPEAFRRFIGDPLNTAARAAIEVMRESISPRKS